MKETSTDKPCIDNIRSWAKSKAHGGSRGTSRRPDPNLLPLSTAPSKTSSSTAQLQPASHGNSVSLRGGGNDGHGAGGSSNSTPGNNDDAGENHPSPDSAPPQEEGQGSVLEPPPDAENKRLNMLASFYLTAKRILLHTWLNVFLVFVPVGIIVKGVPGMAPGVIFAMNAVAIIPLAALLGYATETVAHEMGDSVGALLNITFGNAVELIIL